MSLKLRELKNRTKKVSKLKGISLRSFENLCQYLMCLQKILDRNRMCLILTDITY